MPSAKIVGKLQALRKSAQNHSNLSEFSTASSTASVSLSVPLGDDEFTTIHAVAMDIPAKMGFRDYVAALTLVLLSPYLILAWTFVLLYGMVARLPGLMYLTWTIQRGEKVVKPTVDFYLLTSLETILYAPMLIFGCAHVLIVWLVAFVVTAPIGLLAGVSPIANIARIRKMSTWLDGKVVVDTSS